MAGPFRTVSFNGGSALVVGQAVEVPLPDDGGSYGVMFSFDVLADVSSGVFEGLPFGMVDWFAVRAVEAVSETVVNGTLTMTGTRQRYRVAAVGLQAVRYRVTAVTGAADLIVYARPFALTPALSLTF